MIKTSGAAAIGFVALGTSGCGKNISIYTETVIGSLEELLPLLPNLNDRIKQAISVAKTFDEAYRNGKFESAATLFENLTTLISGIFANLGVMSEAVKLAVAVGGVALRAIAVLLKSQAADPAVAAKVQASPNSSAEAMIRHMANPAVIDAVVAAVKP